MHLWKVKAEIQEIKSINTERSNFNTDYPSLFTPPTPEKIEGLERNSIRTGGLNWMVLSQQQALNIKQVRMNFSQMFSSIQLRKSFFWSLHIVLSKLGLMRKKWSLGELISLLDLSKFLYRTSTQGLNPVLPLHHLTKEIVFSRFT